jgi:hypothetical protein
MLRWIMNHLCQCPAHHVAGYFHVGVVREQSGIPTPTPHRQRFPFDRGVLVLAQELTATQQVDVTGIFKDKKGNVAKVENPQWITSNAQLVNLTADEVTAGGGHKVTVQALGPVGTASISLVADADLGDGVKPVRLDGEINVVAGEASIGELSFGTPAEQPDPVVPTPPPPEPAPVAPPTA